MILTITSLCLHFYSSVSHLCKVELSESRNTDFLNSIEHNEVLVSL